MVRYVLYVEHDHGPHEVSIHDSQAAAESALRDFAAEVFTEPQLVNDEGELLIADSQLLEKLSEWNEHARIYRCEDDGGSVESTSALEQERQHLRWLRWYGDGYVAKLLAGQVCSGCGARLRPSGVEIVGTVVRLICSGCHVEVLAVDTFGGLGVEDVLS